MPYIDLHDKPFDDETIAKLSIFEDYAQAWVPTFVMMGEPTICIFDFFAGSGHDKTGIPGSPIRILQVIKQYVGPIFQKKVKVKVYFNEFVKSKFEDLEKACADYFEKNKDVERAIEIKITNLDFDISFNERLAEISKYPSLVYLDQNGIKFLSEKYFLALEKTSKTDFLYFVSSSYFWRFGEKEEFKMHLDINMSEAKANPYNFIHRSLIAQLLLKLPKTSSLRLYPFSIKKGANIHGIIFGAKHPRAVEKFLSIAWAKNPMNGDANFDIDGDSKKNQLDIFEGKKLTKIEEFQNNLEQKLKLEKRMSNNDIYIFTIKQGHSVSHATSHLKTLKKSGKVAYDGLSPKIKYINPYNQEDLVTIKWI